MKKRVKKKGISPVIATTLLIAIVVVIALIIFLWFRNVIGDYGEKFGKNIELVCEEVLLDTSYAGGTLYVSNDGNVPVFKLNIRVEGSGGYSTTELNEIVSDWPDTGLNQGSVYAGDISSKASGANKILIMPILIGVSSDGGKKTYSCGEQYGYPIIL
jgi:flagellin-like protein